MKTKLKNFWILIFALLGVLIVFHSSVYSKSTQIFRYNNTNYFFSFVVPEKLSCLENEAPAPNHGCKILLQENPECYVSVIGKYNTVDYIEPKQELLSSVDMILEEQNKFEVLRRDEVELSGLPGERLVFKYQIKNQNVELGYMVHDEIAMFKSRSPETEIIYVITLVTTLSRYKKDKVIFESILKTWTAEKEV